MKYSLASDTIDYEDRRALANWLLHNDRLTKGALTPEFEDSWSTWVGMNYSVFCNSGSSANLLMFAVLHYAQDIFPTLKLTNRKVIVPSVGWVTSIAPAIQFGFEPLMCEADPDTFGLDLNHLETLLKAHRPDTVMMVQVLGVPHKMDEMKALQEKYHFTLLEDACAAMGASYKGRNVGSFGMMASFSFYFGHQISTVEGGMVSTGNTALYNMLLMLRSHGWDKDLGYLLQENLRAQYGVDDFHSPFCFFVPGFNLRNTDIGAFLGIRQVEKMNWLTKKREANHKLYMDILGDRFIYQNPPEGARVCSIHFGMLAQDNVERKKIVKALCEHGIETRMFSAGNLGRHPFWVNRYGEFRAPMADRIHDTGLFLPNHPSLTSDDIAYIAHVVLGSV